MRLTTHRALARAWCSLVIWDEDDGSASDDAGDVAGGRTKQTYARVPRGRSVSSEGQDGLFWVTHERWLEQRNRKQAEPMDAVAYDVVGWYLGQQQGQRVR